MKSIASLILIYNGKTSVKGQKYHIQMTKGSITSKTLEVLLRNLAHS